MIEDQYSVNRYFLVVFDINLDVTLCSLLATGFSAVPAVLLVTRLLSISKIRDHLGTFYTRHYLNDAKEWL